MTITTIIVFIFILGLLILVHELGHLLAAKKAGVKVEEFGIGFPPRLFKFKKGGTLYSINLIPLGGYVKEKEESFNKKSFLDRAKILSAGVAMNLVLAVVCLTIICFFVYPWYEAVYMGLVKVFQLTFLISGVLVKLSQDILLSGKLSPGIVGPVGIAGVVDQVVEQGVLNIIYFTGLLSLNLGLVNILPFPALDGGRLVFLGIEKIRGKSVPEKTEKIIHMVGFALLIFLMIAVTWRDIGRLI